MSYCTSLLFCLLPVALFGQDKITFGGKVVDEKSNVPLAYASVSIQRTGIGVTTSEYGNFIFHIPSEYKKDTILISFIGYHSAKVPVSAIRSSNTTTVRLVPNIYVIGEITVVEKKKKKNVKEILQKAIAKIPDNFPFDTFQLSGYYRDYLTENNHYYNFIEAALTIEDKGFSTIDHHATAVKLEQIRINYTYPFDTSYIKKYENSDIKFIPFASISSTIGNEYSMLRSHDPIRNYKYRTTSFIDIFEKDFIPNHRFTLEKVIYQDSVPYYKIRIKTFKYIGGEHNNALGYWVEGYIYIQARTMAITKLDYSLYYTYNNVSQLLVDQRLEYKEYHGKMYLHYFLFMNVFKTTMYGNVHQFNQYRELFVNQIRTKPLVNLLENEIISNDSSLLKNPVPEIKGFWESYNYVGSNGLLGREEK